jgi:phospholipase D1/2
VPPTGSRRRAIQRLVALAAAVGAAFALAFALLPHDADAVEALAGAPAPLLAAGTLGAWILLTPALVSGTLLAAATGLLLGPALGMPVALLGSTLGGALAFTLARRMGRAPVETLAGARLTRLRERVERRPVLAIVLARAAPGSPSTILNHAAGLTRIRLRHFAVGIAIGGAPRVLAYTALSAAAAELALVPALAAFVLLSALGLVGVLVVRRRRASPAAAAG